jgi:hypothetical protein
LEIVDLQALQVFIDLYEWIKDPVIARSSVLFNSIKSASFC